MNGNGLAAQQTVAAIPNQWHVQEVGDFNGDGHSDILWRNDSGQTLLWEMNGFNIQSQQTVAAITNDWHIVA